MCIVGWEGRQSNPGTDEILRTNSDRPRGQSILLYNEYEVTLPWVKRPGRGVDHPLLLQTTVDCG